MRKILLSIVFIGTSLLFSEAVIAQNQDLIASQQFRMGARFIRIAEPGEFADSVNVWGDIGSSGRYVIPEGTNLTKLLTFALGPNTLGGETQLDWSKMRVEVNIQEYNPETGVNTIEKFRYRFEEPFPDGMAAFILENNQTVAVRVKRKPTIRDYIGVVAPAISAIATSIIIVDRLAGN